MVHFDMSHDNGGQKFCKIAKHNLVLDLADNPHYNLALDLFGKNNHLN